VYGQIDDWARFAVIKYDKISSQFVYSARQWNNTASSYVCQLQQQGRFKYQNESGLWVMNIN